MNESTRKDSTILIVGGGASGTIAAIRLLRSDLGRAGRIRIRLFEKSRDLARGVAYGTSSDFHRLNVRHGKMSLFPEDPENFSRWIAKHHPGELSVSFQPRPRYAEYLSSSLAEARRDAPADSFSSVRDEAIGFDRDGDGEEGERIVLRLRSGAEAVGDRIVLSTGHRSPGLPAGLVPLRGDRRLIADPWKPGSLESVGKTERILIVGTGLTAVDLVLSLFRGGHSGPIDLVSRHGLSPLSHPEKDPSVRLDFPLRDEKSVLGVIRELRSAARGAGSDWTGAIDRFRPEISRIWKGWSDRDRIRFLRHARSYWEIHRHRVSPEVHREWDLYRRAGKIRVEGARIQSAFGAADGVRVSLGLRSGSDEERVYDRILNCTGASPDVSLLDGHGFSVDSLRIGIPTDDLGRPIRSIDGNPEPGVYVLGPALRTRYWEMTSIPDLRDQAKRVVDSILSDLGRRPVTS